MPSCALPSTSNTSTSGSSRYDLRRLAREDAGLTLEGVVRLLPGPKWGTLKPEQRKNRVSYIARIERHGTSSAKMARRLAAIYGTGYFLFLTSTETNSQGQEENRRTRLRFRPAKPAAARSRRRR